MSGSLRPFGNQRFFWAERGPRVLFLWFGPLGFALWFPPTAKWRCWLPMWQPNWREAPEDD